MKKEAGARTSKKYVLLVEAARVLFFRHGVKRVTVEEICGKAGVSKMTFYKYFSDKKKLAELIRDELNDEGLAKYDEINREDISFPDKIDLITQWRSDFFSQMSGEFIEDMLDLEDVTEKMKTHYMNVVTVAQKRGEVRRDLSPELIWLVTEKLNDITRDGSWKQVTPDYTEFQRQMRKLFFYGLLEQTGK